MKRILALALACVLLIPLFITGCGEKEEIKGAEVQMFLTTLPANLDPASAYSTADTVKLMGLIYEGLTTIDEKGKLQKAMASDWEYEIDERDDLFKLEIQLKRTRWSDGVIVDADDYIYAWTRVLLPENNNQNAALLYPINNAKAVKEGLVSQNALGIYAVEDDLLQIVFDPAYVNADSSKKEQKAFVEYFMRRLSSPALVPLRQDIVEGNDDDWCSTNNSSYVTNGPFKIKTWTTGELTFERSIYYRCVGDSENNADDKIVKPYRLITLYEDGKVADNHVQKYNEKQCFYLNLATVSNSVISQTNTKLIENEPLMSVKTVVLDNTHPLFANAKVRNALSVCLDRNTLSTFVLGSSPASGFVPASVEDVKAKNSFRDNATAAINTAANVDQAKKLLEEAGVNPADETIVIEYNDESYHDATIAAQCKAVWESLGFTVLTSGDYARPPHYIFRKLNGEYALNQNIESIGAPVVICDVQCVTPDAYSLLVPYSTVYGGGEVDLTVPEVVYSSHISGYSNADYDKICEKIVAAKDVETRTAAMHEAEAKLVADLPVIPVLFNGYCYISQDLSKMENDKYGRLNFTELKQKNFKDYLPRDKEGKIDQ